MGRKFKVTEEQYKAAINEVQGTGIDVQVDAAKAKVDPGAAVKDKQQEIKNAGIEKQVDNIKVPVTEKKTIKNKSGLTEDTLKKLINNSKVYSVRDFLNKK